MKSITSIHEAMPEMLSMEKVIDYKKGKLAIRAWGDEAELGLDV